MIRQPFVILLIKRIAGDTKTMLHPAVICDVWIHHRCWRMEEWCRRMLRMPWAPGKLQAMWKDASASARSPFPHSFSVLFYNRSTLLHGICIPLLSFLCPFHAPVSFPCPFGILSIVYSMSFPWYLCLFGVLSTMLSIVYAMEFTADNWWMLCFCVPGNPLDFLYALFLPLASSSKTPFAWAHVGGQCKCWQYDFKVRIIMDLFRLAEGWKSRLIPWIALWKLCVSGLFAEGWYPSLVMRA